MIAGAVGAALGVSACGLGPREPRVITSNDPASKIPAIKASVEQKDMSAVQQLVKDLDSDDPAVRFYSISALERLTGEKFGYEYFGNEQQRAAAVKQWHAWLAGWQAGQRQALQPGNPDDAMHRANNTPEASTR